MTRKKRSRRKPRTQQGWRRFLHKPAVQIGMVVVAGILIFLVAMVAGQGLPGSVSVDQAHELYQGGTFVLDVRTPEEWNEFHAPDTTLIPLDELPSRLNELPRDQPILVVCRSGNRSQTGRDILLSAGFTATSMNGGMNDWRARGYPVVSGP